MSHSSHSGNCGAACACINACCCWRCRHTVCGDNSAAPSVRVPKAFQWFLVGEPAFGGDDSSGRAIKPRTAGVVSGLGGGTASASSRSSHFCRTWADSCRRDDLAADGMVCVPISWVPGRPIPKGRPDMAAYRLDVLGCWILGFRSCGVCQAYTCTDTHPHSHKHFTHQGGSRTGAV